MIDSYNFLRLINRTQFAACYTKCLDLISLQKPGVPCTIPEYLMKQIHDYFPNMSKSLSFMEGHPISLNRPLIDKIFSSLNKYKESPYLVCQKSNGVRYLLIICKVLKRDLLRVPKEQDKPDKLFTQCYFVSRKGYRKLQCFVVDVGISFDMEIPRFQLKDTFHPYLVQILDGELVMQKVKNKNVFRYLVFDNLFHLGRKICDLGYAQRLQCARRFINCNQMLGMPPHRISVQLKDFFRLNNKRFNVIQFLSQKYIKMLQHLNDGLIFNHQNKPYVLAGSNQGYIKWKPEDLNTADFVLIPNMNLLERYGKRIADLYVGYQDHQLQRHVRLFYAFIAVSEQKFQQLSKLILQKQEQKQKELEKEKFQLFSNIDEFSFSIVAQCRLQPTDGSERQIMSKLSKELPYDLRSNLMRQYDEDKDMEAIENVRTKNFDKNWKILKIRDDKNLPNNFETVKKIEQSIHEAITLEELIQKAKELNQKVYK